MNITSKIILRPDFTRKDGTKSLYLRLTINRKSKYFPLHISCKEKYWLSDKSRVKKSCPNSYRINLLIDNDEAKSNQIIFDYRVKNKELSFAQFKVQFENESYNSKSFSAFVETQKVKFKDLHKPGTLKNYSHQLNKLITFHPEITFSDFDLDFMSKYKQYLITIRGNNKNTATRSLKFIKSMLNKAVESCIIKENPCKNYKLDRIEGKREHLNLKELEILNRLLFDQKLKPNKANVLRYFLFCCYTGLRYSDIRSLKYSNINDGIISIQMHKTGETVIIPIIKIALKLLPNDRNYFANQTIFRVLTDQPTNRYLKDIMKVAGIKKHISFHCARHTFGTIGIDLGMKIDIISKILGHTNVKTTQIYAKYSTAVKKKEMKKLENA